MTTPFLAATTGALALLHVACLPLLAGGEPAASPTESFCIDADLTGVLRILAGGETAVIDNRVRRPLSVFRLTSPTPLGADAVTTGLTELLLLRGVAVARSGDGVVAEDAPDPSEEIVLAVRDKPLSERAPRLLAALHDPDATKTRFTAEDMALPDLLMILELLTGRSIIRDNPLPRVRFSSPDATRGRAEILAEIDAFLVKNGVYLVEHDARFIKAVCAPALLTKDQAPAESDGISDDEARQRMQRVAAEIRRRREMRKKALERSLPDSPAPVPAAP